MKAQNIIVPVFLLAVFGFIVYSILMSVQITEQPQDGDQLDAVTTEETDGVTAIETDAQPEPTDLPGTETEPSDDLDGSTIFDDDHETALMERRFDLVNTTNCLSGYALSGFGNPIYADLTEGDYADAKARFTTLLGSAEAAENLHLSLMGIEKPIARMCINANEVVLVTSMYSPNLATGGSQTRHDLYILPRDVFDEFDVETGDVVYSRPGQSMVLWSDIDPSSISTVPAIMIFEEGTDTMDSWLVYSIDTFFGKLDLIESCEVAAVGGVKKLACDKIYQ
jgi:hypothetical protein